MRLLQLAAVLAAVAPAAVRAVELTSETFKSSIAHGQWLVEHYSPQCHHCRAFAPTWEKLAEENKWREDATGFHMVQVNCLAQGDLCDANGVTGYPAIKLYQDGELVSPYTESRDAAIVQAYIDRQSVAYSKRRPDVAGGADAPVRLGKGGDGKVVRLADKESLQKVKNEGGFVKFFAPWCGHCKKLAPTWVELAARLEGQVQLYEVDCEANKPLCIAEGVPGYPQLILYANGQSYEHTGGRALEPMTTFAKKALSSGSAEYIDIDALKKIAQDEEVFFVYLHTYGASSNDLALVTKASKSLLGSAVIFQSRDLDLFTYTGVLPTSGSALLCIKDHNARTPIASLPFSTESPPTQAEVTAFLHDNKLPTVVKLDSGNFKDVMKNPRESIVVLAGFTTKDDQKLDANILKLREVATAWRKGGRKFSQGVIFAWMDGNKWGKWLKQNYGMTKGNMPQVVVADPIKSEYYDVTLEIQTLDFKGSSIFSTLEGVFQKTLKPKTVESWSDRLSRAMAIKIAEWHSSAVQYPARLAAGGLLCAFLAFMAIKKCLMWEFAHEPVSKEPSRLD